MYILYNKSKGLTPLLDALKNSKIFKSFKGSMPE